MQFAKEKCLNFICLLKSWKEKEEEEPLKHSFGMISSKIDYKISVASLNFANSAVFQLKCPLRIFQVFHLNVLTKVNFTTVGNTGRNS